jgi:hypothetical protein
MQAMHNVKSKNSLRCFIVSFVVMGLLYHRFPHGQQVLQLFTRCLPYVYFCLQDGGG